MSSNSVPCLILSHRIAVFSNITLKLYILCSSTEFITTGVATMLAFSIWRMEYSVHLKTTSQNTESKFFHENAFEKCNLQNVGHFVQASMRSTQ